MFHDDDHPSSCLCQRCTLSVLRDRLVFALAEPDLRTSQVVTVSRELRHVVAALAAAEPDRAGGRSGGRASLIRGTVAEPGAITAGQRPSRLSLGQEF